MTSLETVSALLVLGAALSGPAAAAEVPPADAPPASAFSHVYNAPVVEGRNVASSFAPAGVAANASSAVRHQAAIDARANR